MARQVVSTRMPVPAKANGSAGEDALGRLRRSKPIVEGIDLDQVGYVASPHAIERMGERGISPAEVLSAIVAPDISRPNVDPQYPDTTLFDRGDIRVVADPESNTILTVIDLCADDRVTPRKPNTVVLRNSPKIAAAAKRDATKKRVSAYTSKLAASRDEEEFRFVFGAHRQEDARFMVVTPQLAVAILERNTRNRPKRNRDIDDWSAEMVEGRWKVTHQGIALDRNGVVVDGQHRLEAIIDSNTSQRMLVTVGLAPDTFEVIDTGRRRSTNDSLSLIGENQTAALSAALRLAHMYDNGMHDPDTRYRVQPQVILDYLVGREEQLREAVRWSMNHRKQHQIVQSAMTVVHYLLHARLPKRCMPMAEDFLEGVGSGLELTKGDPRYALRRVVANDLKRRSMPHLALTLKAWGLYARGEHVQVIMWRRGETMPDIYVPPPDVQLPFGKD